MTVKWVKVGKGLQTAYHESRKYGKRFDRYIRGRYMVDGEFRIIPFGWETEWVAAEKATMQAKGETGPRISFLEYCKGELARLKKNALKGEGPTTLKEDRELALEKARQEEQAKREVEERAKREEMRNISFGQFFEETYWPISRSSKKRESSRKEWGHFQNWIKPAVGELPFKDISQIQVEKIKQTMQKKKRSPRSIEYVLATFRQTWNLARESGLTIVDSPSKKVKLHKPDNDRKRYLTDEEADALLDALRVKSEQVYQVSLVSLDTGGRFSEVAGLTWGGIATEKGLITFSDTKMAGGTKSRVVPMTTRLKDLFESMARGGKSDFIFPDKKGCVQGKISHTFYRVVNDLKLNEGVSDPRDKVVFHTMRHSYASNLVQAGVDLYPVQRLMGHSVSKMTERYSHLSNDTLVAAVKKMEDAREKEKKQDKVVQLKKEANE